MHTGIHKLMSYHYDVIIMDYVAHVVVSIIIITIASQVHINCVGLLWPLKTMRYKLTHQFMVHMALQH